MLKYDDFVIMVNEGLITTHPLSKCENSINFELGKLKYWTKVNINKENNTFNIEFNNIPTENELEYLFHVYNVLGYYISYYEIKNKLKQTKNFPWIDFNQYNKDTNNKFSVKLFFESRFDEKLKYTPELLYHVTNIKNVSKIKKYGLMPQYFEKGDFRPDRIYLSLTKKEADNILNKNIINDKIKNFNNKYIIYEIKTKEIQNLMLYKDPRSNGVYTYNHINPNYLIIT